MVSATTTPSTKKKCVTLSVRSVLGWHSEPWAPTWVWAGHRGQSGSLTKREDDAKVTHAGTEWSWQGSAQSSSALTIHLSCHYPRTRALQASRYGQRKARVYKEAAHHVLNSLLRHLPWQFHTGPFSTCHWGWPCLPAVPSEGDLFYRQEPGLAVGRRTSG